MATRISKTKAQEETIVNDIDLTSNQVVIREVEEIMDENKIAELKNKLQQKANKETDETVIEKIKEDYGVSLKFGIVGLGQAGSRLSAEFYSLGYEAVAINTATQDLKFIEIPSDNKLFLDIGIQGAAKDLTRGEAAAQQYTDAIITLVNDHLSNSDVLVVASSLGGGSGAGALETVISLLQSTQKPIIVIGVLPMASEDVKTKSNSIEIISKLTSFIKQGMIHNLILCDNAKLESIYSNVGQLDFYSVANKAIVDTIHKFNEYSMMPSKVKALDTAEFSTILLNGEGISLYGSINLDNYKEETAIAEAVISGLQENLLASGFNLKSAKYVGFMIVANEEVLKQIPSGAINYAGVVIDDIFGSPEVVYRGIYIAKEDVKNVEIYTFASGLSLPESRIAGLKKDVSIQQDALKVKDVDRANKLVVDIKNDDVSEVDKIKQRIANKTKGFGKLNSLIKR